MLRTFFLEEEVTRSYNNFAYQRASTTAVVEMSGWFSVPSSIPGWVFLGNEIGLGPKRKNTQLKEISRFTQLFFLCLQGFLSSFQRPRIFDLLTIPYHVDSQIIRCFNPGIKLTKKFVSVEMLDIFSYQWSTLASPFYLCYNQVGTQSS